MPAISDNSIARAIYEASKDKKGEVQSVFLKNVVQFLARKKLLSKSSDILGRLNTIINDEQGKVAVKVWSAEKIASGMQQKLKQALAKRYGSKEIILEENLDEKLLGGLKIEVNDEIIDLSIKNRMRKLQEHLKKSAQ